MSVSWSAFFYGALDPGATITIDKLAGSFVPQALSARVFGYHDWSLTLPQVIEGVVAVLAMFRAVRRWAGVHAGLLAAGLFALTPVLASMFGHPMEDGMLTMCLVLAADAFSRAVAEARLRSLMLAGVWIGIGFQAKMLQAWMAVPALGLTYLFLAPVPWRKRLVHLLAGAAVLLAVSLSWIGLYSVTPAADRPYVDGSTNNSAFAMVFGYNGVDRFGIHLPGAAPSMFSSSRSQDQPEAGQNPGQDPNQQAGQGDRERGLPVGGGPGGPGGGRPDAGWTKMFGVRYGTQIGWLYPVALLSLALGLIRRRRLDGYVFWGLWLLTYGIVFSSMMLPHTAYLASLAPPLAALSGAGIVAFGRHARDGHRVWRWALPVAVAAEAAWVLYLTSHFAGFFKAIGWIVLGAGVGAVVLVVVRRRVLVPGLVLAVVAILVAPAVWSASVLKPDYGGSAFDASAGPPVQSGAGNFGRLGGGRNGPGAMMGRMGTGDTLSADQRKLHDYLVAHRRGAKYLAASTSWNSAGSFIAATGRPYMPMGGFGGNIPSPSLAKAQALVRSGELHYFMLGAEGFGGGRRDGGTGTQSTVAQITAWVESTCAEVPSTDYGVSTDSQQRQPPAFEGFPGGTQGGPGGPGGGGATRLYSCA
jgi:4-amino-4-deoxy-L-arabinose transferase-like glycosyltransferase